MKKHFISLFDAEHKMRTIYLFMAAGLLIIIPLAVGITDNFPMLAMLLTGSILFFFAVLHPWENAGNYGILVGVSIGILFLEFLGIIILDKMHKPEYISEGIVMGITFLFCLPGILTGIIGAIICRVRKN